VERRKVERKATEGETCEGAVIPDPISDRSLDDQESLNVTFLNNPWQAVVLHSWFDQKRDSDVYKRSVKNQIIMI
jgi:hypothetical protein